MLSVLYLDNKYLIYKMDISNFLKNVFLILTMLITIGSVVMGQSTFDMASENLGTSQNHFVGLEGELKYSWMDGVETLDYSINQGSKFKKNRRTINYTALGFLGVGVIGGGIWSLDCLQDAGAGHQCELGIVIGSFFGLVLGAATLLIAHPINRIKNKNKNSSMNSGFMKESDHVQVQYGFVNGGLGLRVVF